MNKYCYLSGRVNMKAVERTIQNLIGSGMDPKTENNPYLGFIYTSFQERATKVRSDPLQEGCIAGNIPWECSSLLMRWAAFVLYNARALMCKQDTTRLGKCVELLL